MMTPLTNLRAVEVTVDDGMHGWMLTSVKGLEPDARLVVIDSGELAGQVRVCDSSWIIENPDAPEVEIAFDRRYHQHYDH